MDINLLLNIYWPVVESVYALFIVACSLLIYFKTKKLYELSGHKGIKHFRNAFLFWGLAFLLRLMLFVIIPLTGLINLLGVGLRVIYIYLICMGGFSLVYSHIWKGQDRERALYLLALIVALISVFFTQMALYASQIAVFLYAITLTYSNYKARKNKIIQLYFISMVLALIGFIINFLSEYFMFNKLMMVYVYAVTASVFAIILYGVLKTDA